MNEAKIRIGISACLLGAPVRYNGGHKRSTLCTEVLAEHFELVPLCPEMGMGLGTPRPTIRLVGEPEAPRALMPQEQDRDVSEALRAQVDRVPAGLSGFVLMQKSPSCGLHRVKLYRDNGHLAEKGSRGIFAAALHAHRGPHHDEAVALQREVRPDTGVRNGAAEGQRAARKT